MLVFINTANRHRKLTHEHEASRAKLFLATVHCSPDQGFETELPNLHMNGFGRLERFWPVRSAPWDGTNHFLHAPDSVGAILSPKLVSVQLPM